MERKKKQYCIKKRNNGQKRKNDCDGLKKKSVLYKNVRPFHVHLQFNAIESRHHGALTKGNLLNLSCRTVLSMVVRHESAYWL